MMACGGGGSSAGSSAPASSESLGTLPSTETPVALSPVVAPDTSAAILSLPAASSIANNSIVELNCGRVYQGTLDLRGKSGVTVRTAGTCGKAVISPGRPVTGWTQYGGQIWSAPVSFAPAQLLVDAQPVSLAHWPNRPQTWARSSGSGANNMNYAMPNADLAGATLVYRAFDWAIEARQINSYANGVMSLGSLNDTAYSGYAPSGQRDFYVEGKLWMLDEPGEWAVSNGRVYVWTTDGKSPEGRVWAAPDSHGVDAENASGITLNNISLFASANAVNAVGARNLKLASVDISNSARYGVLNSGGSALTVDGALIRNTRYDAIAVRWGGGGEVIRNTRIEAAGVVGMPVNSRAAINLTLGSGATVQDNVVQNAGYIGIRVFRDAVVSGNTVDGACLVLTDCGGVYASAGDQTALNSRIEGNLITRVGTGQRLAWGVFLDVANGVTISNNRITGNGNGMMLLDSGSNTLSGNNFAASGQSHLQMAESGSVARVRNNSVRANTFSAINGEESYRLSSDLGTASALSFGSYDSNVYRSASAVFANLNGAALSFAQWRAQTGQDGASSFSEP